MLKASNILRFVPLVLVFLLHFSCDDDGTTVGDGLTDDSPIEIVYADTFTVNTSTVLLDSVATSTASNILVGRREDEKLGIITSNGYAIPGLTSDFTIDDNDSEFDSLTLVLFFSYSYYDTINPQTISVHRVLEEIEPEDDGDGLIYNIDTFAHDPTPLGSITFTPTPVEDDSIEIRLSDALGLEIFNLAIESAEEVENNQEFIDFLRGLVIKPGENDNGAILGFNFTSYMRLYYREPTEIAEDGEMTFEFPLLETNFHFNNITTDRTGTKLSPIVSQEEQLSSTLTDNESYIAAGLGFMTRVDIPNLRYLLETEGEFTFVSAAELELHPSFGSYRDNTPLPPALTIYETNRINTSLVTLNLLNGLILDEEFERDTYYSISVTDYINRELEDEEFDDDGLLISLDPAVYGATTDRIYLRDENNEEGVRLILYISTVNE